MKILFGVANASFHLGAQNVIIASLASIRERRGRALQLTHYKTFKYLQAEAHYFRAYINSNRSKPNTA